MKNILDLIEKGKIFNYMINLFLILPILYLTMGTYLNILTGLEYPKLQIITVRDIFEKGMRLTLPNVANVLKEAELKQDVGVQNILDLEIE